MTDTQREWFMTHLKRMADETGEPWLLLDGFVGPAMSEGPSSMSIPHGVPRSYATAREVKQAIEEVHPSGSR